MPALALLLGLAGGAAAATPPCTLPQAMPLSRELEAGFCELPTGIRTLAARQSACLYFSSEPPYDAARKAELDAAIQAQCPGNAATFKRLQRRYARDPKLQPWLERYGRWVGFLPPSG